MKQTIASRQRTSNALQRGQTPKPLISSNLFVAVVSLLGLALLLAQTGCVGATGAQPPAAASTGNSDKASSQTLPGALSSSVTSLNFNSVAIGSSSILSVTFANSGTASITISNTNISGAGFNASGVPTGTILTAGQTATLVVTFEPAATGSAIGTVTVTSNAANSPQTISLAGTAVKPVQHSVALSWRDTSSVAGYNVYQATVSGGLYTKLTSSLDTLPSYTDSTVTDGQTYYYVVTAVGSDGLESAYSNATAVVIPAP